jgi:transposase-like protein
MWGVERARPQEGRTLLTKTANRRQLSTDPRLDAVRAVLGGAQVTEVAGSVGVSRQTVHEGLTRYLVDGVAGLADRSHRPHFCPHAMPETMRVRLLEIRLQHPLGGSKRIRM